MFTERIHAGADLLDAKFPGWRTKVNVSTLDMQTYDNCILGHVFKAFYRGLDELQISYDDAMDLGFCGAVGDYNILTDQWVDFLTQDTE